MRVMTDYQKEEVESLKQECATLRAQLQTMTQEWDDYKAHFEACDRQRSETLQKLNEATEGWKDALDGWKAAKLECVGLKSTLSRERQHRPLLLKIMAREQKAACHARVYMGGSALEVPCPDLDRVLAEWRGMVPVIPTPDRGKIIAPFTPEQVDALNHWQKAGQFHPFTCGSGRRADADHLDGEGVLVAGVDGWKCPYCDYTQGWAHAVMAIEPPTTPMSRLNGSQPEMGGSDEEFMEQMKEEGH